MNESNRLELASKLHELGFPRSLNAYIERMMNTGTDQFSLAHTHEFKSPPNGRKVMLCELQFQTLNGRYRLKRYKAETWHRDAPHQRIFTFKVGDTKGTTLPQAANLLDGRAVKGSFKCADSIERPAWLKIGWPQAAAGGYTHLYYYVEQARKLDLSANLKKLPFLQSDDSSTHQQRIERLERGDVIKVEVGSGKSFYLTVDPGKEKIIVTNAGGITLSGKLIDKLLERLKVTQPRITARNYRGLRR